MKKISRLLSAILVLMILVLSAFFLELNYEKFVVSDDVAVTQGCLLYPQLSDRQQQIYRRVYRYSNCFQTTIPLMNCDEQDILTAVRALIYDHPEFYWFADHSYQYSRFLIVVEMNEEEKNNLETQYIQCLLAADEIIAQFNYQNSFEAILQAHDYIIQNTEYVSDSQYSQDIRSVLLNHESVCAGYARTFEFLCHRMGYGCGYAQGYSTLLGQEQAHGWNYVVINNESYWVDVTWDDLDTKSEDGQQCRYNFFLISDDILNISHQLATLDGLNYPQCTSYQYSVFTGNDKPLTNYKRDEFDQLVIDAIKTGEEFDVQFINENDFNNAVGSLKGDGDMDGLKKLVRTVYPTEGFEITYSFDENENRIWFSLTIK